MASIASRTDTALTFAIDTDSLPISLYNREYIAWIEEKEVGASPRHRPTSHPSTDGSKHLSSSHHLHPSPPSPHPLPRQH